MYSKINIAKFVLFSDCLSFVTKKIYKQALKDYVGGVYCVINFCSSCSFRDYY